MSQRRPTIGDMLADRARKESLQQLSRQVGLIRQELERKSTAIAALPAPYRGRTYVVVIDHVGKGGKQLLLRFFVLNGEDWTHVPDSPSAQCLRRDLEHAMQKMYVFYANMDSWLVDLLAPGSHANTESR